MMRLLAALSVVCLSFAAASAADCRGSALPPVNGLVGGKLLPDGSIVGRAKMNINIDGYGKAYHPKNAEAGALIHLCNAGEVFLPGGRRYHGSVSNTVCTGDFMRDFAAIRAAGWADPRVGAINWYGILGQGSATVAGRTVQNVKPVEQRDGSGFFVSPTSLADPSISDQTDQRRYVDPLRVPAAVIPRSDVLAGKGVKLGSLGVAIDPAKRIAVPFIVGDGGPRVGEGTPALARRMAGLPVADTLTRPQRFQGQVDAQRVVWVFFGASQPVIRYSHADQQAAIAAADAAFERWGGLARLRTCFE